MVKQDPDEIAKMKQALGNIDKSVDPTVGAGMNIDDLMDKLMQENQNQNPNVVYETFDEPEENNAK